MKEKQPKMVFLMETKLRTVKMESIWSKLGFPNMIVVDNVEKSGGLALLWSEAVGVEAQNFSHRHINAVVHYPPTGSPWKFNGFYGHPDATKRHEVWSLLKILAQFQPELWACIGNFNEIMADS